VTRGIVATSHFLASEAAGQVLRDGGNAIDAAVAADAVLCVVYPHMTSIGGDLFALVWPAGEARPVGLAGGGRSGELASVDALRERGQTEMPARGPATITVPGTVEAWGRLIERYGSLGLAPVLDPAAALARDGFEVTDHLAAYLAENAVWLHQEAEAARLLPQVGGGVRLRNTELAACLEHIGRYGTIGFYRGDIAAAIAAGVMKRDGFVTAADLAAHRSQWVDPLEFTYRGRTVYQLPPPTQGLALLGMLARFQEVAQERLRPGAAFASELRRVRDSVYALRDRYISDPDFTEVPLEPFFDPSHAAAGGAAIPEGDTIYLCAADEHGNVVSLIQSVANSFGSGVIAEGTGFLLQNRGCYFSLDPTHVNRLEPRKRTMHTLIPGLAAVDGKRWAAFGTMGADGQPQLQAQVILGLIDEGLDPAEAVSRPRIRVAPGGVRLDVEADYPEAGSMTQAGLELEMTPPRSSRMGHAQALIVDEPGRWRAGADPRADGSVVEIS
jgi:gamma-glutamyltranspeptidase/glutathione hydrolase